MLVPDVGTAVASRRAVAAMFDVIAPRYDRFTRMFSFGMDARWKRRILSWIRDTRLSEGAALDIACGTGDLCFAVAQTLPAHTVIGMDVSENMLHFARVRQDAPANPDRMRNIVFMLGDAMLPACRAESLALVTAGYGFRNVPDFRAALRQIALCLREGGVLVTLDFYQPRSRLWCAAWILYLRVTGLLVGWWWHRSPEVYGYIAKSIESFVTADEFATELKAAGFQVVQEKRWLLGGIAAHMAIRRETEMRE